MPAKGDYIAIDTHNARQIAALISNGQLMDLVVDAPDASSLQPEEIYIGKIGQSVKGLGAVFVDLGQGQRGFLKETRGLAPGAMVLVQIQNAPQAPKAPVVSRRLSLKSRYAIATPGAPGRNISRQIKEEARIDALQEMIAGLAEYDDIGLIIRSAAAHPQTHKDEIAKDAEAVLAMAYGITQALASAGAPELIVEAPDAASFAWREWWQGPGHKIIEEPGCFERLGLWEEIERLKSPHVALGPQSSLIIEACHAFVAIDINTGGAFGVKSGEQANALAAQEIPRQLLLRGLGGQIVIDPAPMPKSARRGFEQSLAKALRRTAVDTQILGWTPLGHLELQRKSERVAIDFNQI